MQKIILYLLLSAAIISCSVKNNFQTEDMNISVTLTPFADLVKQITGNRANVYTLFPPGVNAHSYEPSPGNIKNVIDSKIYFRVGRIFKIEESILNKIEIDTSETKIVDCSSRIKLINDDPHYWLSPDNVKIITKTMLEVLEQKYPQHTNYFRNNRKRFIRKLDSIDQVNSKIINFKNERSFFVYHPAWTYLADHYKLKQYSIEENGKTPKAKAIKDFTNLAKEKNAKVIFYDPHFDNTSVMTVANSLKIKVDSLNPLPENYLLNLTEIGNKFNEYLE